MTFHHVFMCWKRIQCLILLSRSNMPKDVRKFATCCICGFCSRLMSSCKSMITMGSFPRNRSNASSRSGRCSRVDGGKYTLMSKVRCPPKKTSHLTIFGPWKSIDSTLHQSYRLLTTRPTPPCASQNIVPTAWDHIPLYPRWLFKYA